MYHCDRPETKVSMEDLSLQCWSLFLYRAKINKMIVILSQFILLLNLTLNNVLGLRGHEHCLCCLVIMGMDSRSNQAS